jgi:hypothetical protein
MNATECVREREIVRCLLSRTFDGLSDDLRAHAEACDVCRDVMCLVEALRDERDNTLADVRLPAAGQVWWRSALRAHAEAARAARRPMVWLQGVAGACVVGILAAILTLTWPSIYDGAVALAALPAAFDPDVAPLVDALRSVIRVAVAVVACLVLTPIAVYLALSDE